MSYTIETAVGKATIYSGRPRDEVKELNERIKELESLVSTLSDKHVLNFSPSSRWQHINGNYYNVLLIANEHSQNQENYPTTVVYRGDNNLVWSRPLRDWHRSMTLVSGEDNGQLP